ncbi:hypothetical protein CAOG_02364 [Capsaspora owczarzaki ATCC 30864]|uniref:Uncharacterized protein n=1 Tax=Capsaspora owczarzaki (strain ATCC 30864) TaxID=595528 RepID=A0A0D2X1Q1_CAPO3|nr:hypothetical protein CAOG_02364 [Capsaspora owczarzaki ATCC 30864]KJE91199.1 hypothetical protein CAOG_002364 [Capsaspora owczarzaki ATCC 30864]|eukprot:XP_004349114.1 hypothetical protein CAOG_02364 [Capsaspora owczarzaki ATCC 30864]
MVANANVTALSGASDALPRYSQSLEEYVIAGGDERMHLSKQGVNKYFAQPKPVSGLILRSSCTGTNPSEHSFAAAQAVLTNLQNGTISFDAQMDLVRSRLIQYLGLQSLPGLDVIINPSGTDCEYAPLLAALAVLGRPLSQSDVENPPIVNILTAGGEVGSMSATAASGAHFQLFAPNGDAVTVGAPLDGIPKGAIQVHEVVYRNSQGEVVDKAAEALALARQHLELGKIVVLHSVPSSKMGLVVSDHPDILALQQEFGTRLIRVIDACQLRCQPVVIKRYLAEGALVMVTGSKYFEAPSFCGAVFVPEQVASVIRDKLGNTVAVPSGFGQYLTRSDIGSSFTALRNALPERENVGLCVRWEFALSWLAELATLGQETVERTIRAWVSGVRLLMQEFSESIELFSGESYDDDTLMANCNTIVAFKVRANGAFLTTDPLKNLYALLWQDLSSLATTDAERLILSQQCQIGQPVKICNEFAVLRFALGASTTVRMAKTGVERELEGDRRILDKLAWLVAHFDQLPKA